MLSRKELISFCLKLSDSFEDYPFDTDRNDPSAWTVMRHQSNRKSFALIFERNGTLNINLKCEPAEADFLRSVYPAVTAAYHMNKEHWNGVVMDGSVPDNEIYAWITESYRLTLPKQKQKHNQINIDKPQKSEYNSSK